MSVIKKMIVVLISAFFILGLYLESPYRNNNSMSQVKAVEVTMSDISDYVNVTGRVVELGRRELYPAQASRVISIFATQGQMVDKGEIIMELETEDDSAAAKAFYSEAMSFLEKGNFSALKAFSHNGEDSNNGERYYLISPIDGMVMDVYCGEGELLSGMFPCAAVTDMSRLGVSAEIGEINATKIKTGMKCTVKSDVFSDDIFEGEIAKVTPYASAASLLAEDKENKTAIVASINEKQTLFRPGYSASIKIKLGTYRDRIILPYNCIDQDDRGEYVMKIGPNMLLERTYVITGMELENGTEIVEGLEEGDMVVEYPGNYSDGETVRLLCD